MSEQIRMCDVIPGREAVALYIWPWGESGACSQEGQFLLQQQAGNLGQQVTFTPLNVPAPKLTLDERAAMAGRIFALEAELVEVRSQMHTLYVETEKLRSDNRMMIAQADGARAGLVLAEQRSLTAQELLGEAKAELVGVQEEARSLRLMAPRIEEIAAVNQRVAEQADELATLRLQLDERDRQLSEANQRNVIE